MHEVWKKYERKNLTDNEIKKYKMTEGEIFEKYDNLCENELNSENNKEVYIRKVVMTSVIVSSKKKRKKEKRKKEK